MGLCVSVCAVCHGVVRGIESESRVKSRSSGREGQREQEWQVAGEQGQGCRARGKPRRLGASQPPLGWARWRASIDGLVGWRARPALH